MRAKSSSILLFKKNVKSEKELINFANNSNDLLITNLMFKDRIEKYKKYINFIKNLFNYISKNNNIEKEEEKNNIKNIIKEKIQQNNNEIKVDISSLNKEINNIKKNNNKKLEEKNKYLEYYINQYDKLKEDNFILENTIFSKDNFIKIFLNKLNYYESFLESKNDISEEEECEEDKIEEIRERFIFYSKKVNNEHQKELLHFQNDLSKISKEHNREIIKTSRLETEKNELNDYIKQIKDHKENNSMTEYNLNKKSLFKQNNKNNLIYDNIDFNKKSIIINKENKLNEELLFKDFENENLSDDEDSILLSEINYEIDLDNNNDNLNIDLDNNNNFLKKSKMPKIDLTAIAQKQELRKINENNNINKNEFKLDKININENFKTPSLVLNGLNNLNKLENESSENIKKLNLKQIEFNKVRVITDYVSSNENAKYINNIDYKINKIKKEIMKEKKKLESKKILINKFKNHYKIMRKYIKKQMKDLEIDDNTKYCRTEENIQYCKEDYIY